MNKLIQYLKNQIWFKRTEDILIKYLKNEIWFRTGPSSIHGVGLFAIRDIPKGTDIMVEFDGKGET